MKAPLLAAALAAALVPAAATPAPAAPPVSAPCQVVAVSTSFVTDGTALCAFQEHRTTGTVATALRRQNTAVEVWATTDSGRSWKRAAGTGLPGAEEGHEGPTLGQLVLSPSFASDRTAYLWAGSDGLYRSRDLGATWERDTAGPPTSEPTTGRLTPVAVGPTHALLYAWPTSVCALGRRAPTDAVVVWPVALPAAGAPCDTSTQYLVLPGTTTPLLLAGSTEARLWTCDVALACERSVVVRSGHRPVQAWTGGGRVLYAHLVDARTRTSALSVSRDGGTTWAPWVAAERVLPRRPLTSLGLAVSADGRRIVLRTSTNQPRSASLRYGGSTAAGGGEERLHVSDDGGARFRPLGGRLPFDAPHGHGADTGGVWFAGDRLLTLAERTVGRSGVESAGIWCSVDGGRSWAPRCAR